jgi:hypothetical protein
MSERAYLLVEPGMGWLDNAMPEAVARVSTISFVFFRFPVYQQCTENIDNKQILNTGTFYNGTPIPNWFSKISAILHNRKNQNRWRRVISRIILSSLFSWLPSRSFNGTFARESDFIFADFSNLKVFGSPYLGEFKNGSWIHVDHGINLEFRYTPDQLASLSSCRYFLCWTTRQRDYFSSIFDSSRVIFCVYQKLINPVVWKHPIHHHESTRRKVVFVSRPLDSLYIQPREFEKKFLALVKVCARFNLDLIIKQHPKEASADVYSKFLGHYAGIHISIFDGQLSELGGLSCDFAVAIYTGTVFETLAQGIPNIQLASESATLQKQIRRQYVDAGVTEEFRSDSEDELAHHFERRNELLEGQRRRMKELLYD